jgi:hypothetical protein
MNFPISPATPNGSSTHFWYSKVELDQKETRCKDAKSRFPEKGATQGREKL